MGRGPPSANSHGQAVSTYFLSRAVPGAEKSSAPILDRGTAHFQTVRMVEKLRRKSEPGVFTTDDVGSVSADGNLMLIDIVSGSAVDNIRNSVVGIDVVAAASTVCGR